MHPKDAAGIANPDQTALFAQTCLSEHLGTLRYSEFKTTTISTFQGILNSFNLLKTLLDAFFPQIAEPVCTCSADPTYVVLWDYQVQREAITDDDDDGKDDDEYDKCTFLTSH